MHPDNDTYGNKDRHDGAGYYKRCGPPLTPLAEAAGKVRQMANGLKKATTAVEALRSLTVMDKATIELLDDQLLNELVAMGGVITDTIKLCAK